MLLAETDGELLIEVRGGFRGLPSIQQIEGGQQGAELFVTSDARLKMGHGGCVGGRSWVEQESLELYSRPMWEAARALVSLPSPDLAAFKIKLEVIDREEVWNDGNFDGDCWEIVKADAARLRVAA